MTSWANSLAYSAVSTTFTPPLYPVSLIFPIPLPPERICDLITHPPLSFLAILYASSSLNATSPMGMETLNEFSKAPAWYSWSLIPLN